MLKAEGWSVRAIAEALGISVGSVQGTAVGPASASIALPRPRIVVDRKDRGVRVEVMRAQEVGQLEMLM